ncbi:hypothetical protein FGG08_003608 [Glutinoglossum americanum]|uniref:ribonuclease Z n=1 Tax=Glutinoglossum americanum TaxID=1670608 RepID=A0A9P8L3I4_9PEZI|nr:hypothetical protein FGG08_003608 [Glutinoglossum americanum]
MNDSTHNYDYVVGALTLPPDLGLGKFGFGRFEESLPSGLEPATSMSISKRSCLLRLRISSCWSRNIRTLRNSSLLSDPEISSRDVEPRKVHFSKYSIPKGHIPHSGSYILFLFNHILNPLPSPPAGEDYRRMRSHVEFLTTPTADTPGTTLLLHFDKKRYLIGNIAEGTQRACVQRGVKLTKVSDIFLTGRVEWANTGGLIGMILSLADVLSTQVEDATQNAKEKAERLKRQQNANGDDGKPNEPTASFEKPTLTLHGGRNLAHTLATARRFVFRKGMAIELDEYGGRDTQPTLRDEEWEPTFIDENIKAWAMAIPPSTSNLGTNTSPISTTFKSPRKRSFDMVDETQTAEPGQYHPRESFDNKRNTDDLMRKAIISEMFNSGWRLDHLVEKPLSEVPMPAAIFIRDPETGKISKYSGPMPQETGSPGDQSGSMDDIKVLVRQPWPGALIKQLPPTSPSREALSYFIKNHDQRGRFLPEKAKVLGVEKGPKWADLAKGKSVGAIDGSIITPEMVLAEGTKGTGFAVVDLPSKEYVDGLVNREEWKTEAIMDGIGVILWILGPEVGKDERLGGFLADMSHIIHIMSSPDYCPNYLAFDSSATATIQLSQLDPSRFRLPIHDNLKVPQLGDSTPDTLCESPPFQTAQRGTRVQLHPKFEVQDQFVEPPLNTAKVSLLAPEEVLLLAQTARDELQDDDIKREIAQQQNDIPGQDVEIVTLGTGSCLPSKYRNVLATLVRVPGAGSYLFDCGENTLGQLRRMFRAEEVSEILRDLKAIWISHLHADHHLGITSVIKAWHEEVWDSRKHQGSQGDSVAPPDDLLKVLQREKRLFVLSDSSMIQWLREYASVENYGFDKLVPLSIRSARPSRGVSSVICWGEEVSAFDGEAERGPKELQGYDHCRGARAVSVTFPDGFKFSYSGDCRPSKDFAAIGRGSTVLLHEATFDDELQGDAQAKKHSTTSEALGVGVAMGARRVILTHFSQRYQKIPVMDSVEGQDLGIDAAEIDVPNSEDGHITIPDTIVSDPTMPTSMESSVVKIKKPAFTDMKIGVAFDFMRVKVGEIAHLERFTPALTKLFKRQEAEEEPREVEGGTQKNKQKTSKSNRAVKAIQIEATNDKTNRRERRIVEHGRGGPQDGRQNTTVA